jgi:hypothetical protein
MLKRILIVAVLAVALPLAAYAQGQAGSPSFNAMAKETKKFSIVKLDKPGRVVTIKSANGDTLSIPCGDEVKNFAQLKVGDEVTTTYTESVTIHVEGGGEAGASNETMTSRAKPGEKPSGSIIQRVTAKATIKAIDKTKGTVTLQPMNEAAFTVTAEDKANLDRVQVGNVVVVSYTVGHAISVTTPAAKKAPAKTTKS